MKINTSYYAVSKKIEGKVLVSIAINPPWWFKGKAIPELAPTAAIKNLPVGEYEAPFEKLIRGRKAEITKALEQFEDESIVLLCYEKNDSECHRHIAAKVLKEWGYLVEGEIQFQQAPAKPKKVKVQMEMF